MSHAQCHARIAAPNCRLNKSVTIPSNPRLLTVTRTNEGAATNKILGKIKHIMKLSRLSLALLAASSLLSLAPSVRAEDPAAPTPPPAPARRAGGGRMAPEAQLKDLTEKLTLTAEQQPKVKAILEERAKAMQGARDLTPEERQTKMKTLREENTKKMKEILTPEQFTKYEELQKTQRGPRNGGGAAPAPAEGGAKKKTE